MLYFTFTQFFCAQFRRKAKRTSKTKFPRNLIKIKFLYLSTNPVLWWYLACDRENPEKIYQVISMLIMFLKIIQPCSPTKGFMCLCHAALWLLLCLCCLNVGTAPWALPAWSKHPPEGAGLWGDPAATSETPQNYPAEKEVENLMQM